MQRRGTRGATTFQGAVSPAGLISRLEPQKDPSPSSRQQRPAGDGRRGLPDCDRRKRKPLGCAARRDRQTRPVRHRGPFPFRGGVRPYLRAFDLFVLPSRWESLPISVLEAMACRVPVLASSVCGTPEAVVDGRTGRLIPSGDTRALASALEELLWDRDSRRTRQRGTKFGGVELHSRSNGARDGAAL